MAGLPRTVIKWLQSLDLTYPIKNPKWDIANGFLVAEIFSWYYPGEIKMFAFSTGQSLDTKMSNWSLLKKFVVRNNVEISNDIIDATMHCKEGAAIILIERMYQILTNRPIQKAPLDYDIDFTDWPYQQKLPFHARSNASKSIKNNIKGTELNTDPNLKLAAKKAETLLSFHVEHRKQERETNPKRFSVRKTIAEKCIQRPKPDQRRESDFSYEQEQMRDDKSVDYLETENYLNRKPSTAKPMSENYKEIRVRQEAYDLNMEFVN